MSSFDLTNRYEPEKVVLIDKFDPNDVISAVYYHGGNKTYYIKRFIIETLSTGKRFNFISEEKGSRLEVATNNNNQKIRVYYSIKRKDAKKTDEFLLDELIETKGWKAIGNKLSNNKIRKVELLNGKELKPEEVPESKHVPVIHKAVKTESVRKKGVSTSRQVKEGSRSDGTENKVESQDLNDDFEEDPVQAISGPERKRSIPNRKMEGPESGSKTEKPVSVNKESDSVDTEADQKVEKIKLVQKKRKVKDLTQDPEKDKQSSSGSQEDNDAADPSVDQKPAPEDEIFEVGSTIDLNFDQPRNKDDQLDLFGE